MKKRCVFCVRVAKYRKKLSASIVFKEQLDNQWSKIVPEIRPCLITIPLNYLWATLFPRLDCNPKNIYVSLL